MRVRRPPRRRRLSPPVAGRRSRAAAGGHEGPAVQRARLKREGSVAKRPLSPGSLGRVWRAPTSVAVKRKQVLGL